MAAPTSGSMPGMKYSAGIPMRRPRMSPVSAASKSGTGTSAEVESQRSWPAIACSRMAASRTSFVIGPIWSSDDANATSP